MRAMKWIGLIGLVLCTGCAGPGRYWRDRGNDLLDCFTLEAGIGFGADVELHATDLIATGAGLGVSFKRGLPAGEPGSAHVGLPFLPILSVLHDRQDRRLCGGQDSPHDEMLLGGLPEFLQFLITDRSVRDADLGSMLRGGDSGRPTASILFLNVLPFAPKKEWERPSSLANIFDVDVGATLMPLSARVGFSPGQFADFVLGFFGLDVARDDRRDEMYGNWRLWISYACASPSEVRAGGEVVVRVDYTLHAPRFKPGREIPVTETRVVTFKGSKVAEVETRVARGPVGGYQSLIPIVLPAGAIPGTYEVAITVAAGNRSAQRSRSFTVR